MTGHTIQFRQLHRTRTTFHVFIIDSGSERVKYCSSKSLQRRYNKAQIGIEKVKIGDVGEMGINSTLLKNAFAPPVLRLLLLFKANQLSRFKLRPVAALFFFFFFNLHIICFYLV